MSLRPWGACQWDIPDGIEGVPQIRALEKKYRICAGSINPNLFQAQEYKYGSICNPDPEVRQKALTHLLDCVEIARQLGSQDISPWVSDGSNYPGTQSMRQRIGWMEEIFSQVHPALQPDQRLLIEYKPFEPAFYHTDIADWGMALELARLAGPQAKVLVDTGHHYQAQNIEQIVAWLLHLEMLGGFHLNDRRYADDDLTLGSIDPYQVFRIFHEILSYTAEPGNRSQIAFMIDQSHNLKGKVEAMVQTVARRRSFMPRRRWWIWSNWIRCRDNAGWWRRRSFSARPSGRMFARWCAHSASDRVCRKIPCELWVRAAT